MTLSVFLYTSLCFVEGFIRLKDLKSLNQTDTEIHLILEATLINLSRRTVETPFIHPGREYKHLYVKYKWNNAGSVGKLSSRLETIKIDASLIMCTAAKIHADYHISAIFTKDLGRLTSVVSPVSLDVTRSISKKALESLSHMSNLRSVSFTDKLDPPINSLCKNDLCFSLTNLRLGSYFARHVNGLANLKALRHIYLGTEQRIFIGYIKNCHELRTIVAKNCVLDNFDCLSTLVHLTKISIGRTLTVHGVDKFTKLRVLKIARLASAEHLSLIVLCHELHTFKICQDRLNWYPPSWFNENTQRLTFSPPPSLRKLEIQWNTFHDCMLKSCTGVNIVTLDVEKLDCIVSDDIFKFFDKEIRTLVLHGTTFWEKLRDHFRFIRTSRSLTKVEVHIPGQRARLVHSEWKVSNVGTQVLFELYAPRKKQ
jgi:hypothetical protein